MPRQRTKPCIGVSGSRCPELTTHPTGRCDRCRSEQESRRDAQRGSATARGYGADHRRLRDEWAPKVAAGTVRCAHPDCGELIQPGEQWDLGHDKRRNYRGPEHRACNRATRGPRRQTLPAERQSDELPNVLDTF